MGERNTMENTKRILITNDDGIDAKGLKRLAEAASKYGEVWVVAPDGQRSAASHSLTINDPLDVYPADWKMEMCMRFPAPVFLPTASVSAVNMSCRKNRT